MKIIKPQQLVYLKNSYQFDKNCYMGISVVAGCYLKKTNQFVTEAEIWDAWEKSPKSVPFLDVPILKQFAEYVLVGHAHVGESTKVLDAEVKIGSLKKQWRVFGNGSYFKRNNFQYMSMDHVNTWGGKTSKANPIGKGNNLGEGAPTVVLRREDSLYEQDSLASPSPIPYEFLERKQYIDLISPVMSTAKYLEEVYPGYPKEIDLRYFQISAPDQWLKSHEWPSDIDFSLTGFSEDGETLNGKIPNISARAFGFINNELKEEIPLFLQTIWFATDFDMALLVFTGEVLIEELSADPYDDLLIALDNRKRKKKQDYYVEIHQQRKQSKLKSLLDYDLMPSKMKLNVIHAPDNHPSSMKYEYGPMPEDESKKYYKEIIQSMESEESQDEVDMDKLLGLQHQLVSFDDVFELSDEKNFNSKNYRLFNVENSEVKNRIFTNCSFKNISFNGLNFISCEFIQCYFYNCTFEGNQFTQSILNGIYLNKCKLLNNKFCDSKMNSSTFYRNKVDNISFEQVEINGGNIDLSVFSNVNYIDSNIDNVSWIDSTIKSIVFKNSTLSLLGFERVKVNSFQLLKSKLEKSSINESKVTSLSFIESFVESFVLGTHTKFSKFKFTDCWLEKIGFGNSSMQLGIFEYCDIKEINGSRSDFKNTHFVQCDMMTVIFKEANLFNTEWIACGLQQSIFYNSNIEDAKFKDCNLIGANFGMVKQNDKTSFRGSLVDSVLWLPKKI